MRIVRLPGVFKPRSDTWLLAAHLRRQPQVRGAVLDLCTGSGALAVAAAGADATSVTAVDLSWRAVITAQLNARLNGVRVRTRRGSLLDPVPADRGTARHTEGGRDGGDLLDRTSEAAPAHLNPGGVLMVTHSSINGEETSLERMRAAGLEAGVLGHGPRPPGPPLTDP